MSKILVSYFSARGRTKKKAIELSQILHADLYEITPILPYTRKDLNWMNPFSRSSKEMHDKSSRPQIIKDNLSIDQYDVILVGFPIWWYIAPTIVNTFLEAHDFTNKKIAVFATSGSSGIGDTLDYLKPSVSNTVKWLEPKIVNKKMNKDDIINWIQLKNKIV